MFILILNPINGPERVKNKSETSEVENNQTSLKPKLDDLRGLRNQIGSADGDIEELKKKGIEVLDGGVDPIAGARIKLKINGKEYDGVYGGVGGVDVHSLRSNDGTSASQDVINLVKENNKLITRVGMRMANHH